MQQLTLLTVRATDTASNVLLHIRVCNVIRVCSVIRVGLTLSKSIACILQGLFNSKMLTMVQYTSK